MGDVQRFTNCTTGGPVFVDVQDGKIIRLVPLEFDDTDAPSWVINARGKEFTPPRRALVSPWTVAHRSTVYSPKRILTPLKRADFDPKGERNIGNRGTSGYEPISWEEAWDLVAEEIIRVKREFGPCAIYTQPSSHQMWGNVGYRFSCYQRFLNAVGMTYIEPNPDSWEGWLWGGAHMWGNTHRLGNLEGYDLLEDSLKHTDMIVFWSSDPDTTQGGVYAGYESLPWRRWLKDLGVKMIFIDPYFNHTAGQIGDKWLAPRPGTDVPLALAIAYTWLTEGTYDKEYVAARTVGFDEWKDYVLGTTDGRPKTPEWAEAESGVLARDIRALAREWAVKKTMLAAGGLAGLGGAARCASGAEWPRAMIALVTMQGLGKPGSNLWSTSYGPPQDETFFFPGYTEGGISGDIGNSAAGKDFVYRMFPRGGAFSLPHRSAEGSLGYRLRTPEIMMHQPHEWYGRGFTGSHIEAQFHKFQYPAPGYSMAQMYYRFGGSFFGTMTDTNKHVKAYREGKVPFVVSQAIWMEGEAKFADVILPACTNFERWDIGEWTLANGYVTHSSQMANHRIITLQHKAIEPLGESKSDYEIFRGLAARLGLEGMYSMGRNELDWVKAVFDATDLPTVTTWDDFVKKGYYVVPPRPVERKSTPGMRWFAEDRERDTPDWGPAPWEVVQNKGLQTQSGKIEFVSNSLKRAEATGLVDPERPVMGPQYIPSWEGHRTTDLLKRYPLQLIMPHPRYTFHTHNDAKDSWTNEIKDHRVLHADGRYYWIIRIASDDAATRGIADGDLVRAFNDRGSVILSAQVTERMVPGVAHSYESCAEYDPIGTPGESSDRGGCVNVLSPSRFITPMSSGMANNSCLIQIEKYDAPLDKEVA